MLSVYSISKPTCHILVTDGDGHAIHTIMVKKPYFSCHTFSEQKCEGILNDSGTLVSVNSGSECPPLGGPWWASYNEPQLDTWPLLQCFFCYLYLILKYTLFEVELRIAPFILNIIMKGC